MIFTVPLQPGTSLVNVLYKWLVSGAFLAPTSSGVTQPDTNIPYFRIDTGGNPPAGAEGLVVYDSTALSTNWNNSGYQPGVAALANAQQILLATLYTPGAGVFTLTPAPSTSQSIARVYGTFYDLSSVSVDGITATFALVQVDANDPTITYDMSATLVRNKETGQLVTQRVITANIVLGQLQDVNANAYVGLTRTDYMLDQNGIALPRMRYLLTCPQLGAPVGLGLLATAGPIAFLPVTFVLDTTNTNVSGAGVLDISKLKPT